MIKREFIDYLAEKSKAEQKYLIEKDFILQDLITKLVKNKYFDQNFAFKGGTCLIKCYFGYYRFSEDLDFTWVKQNLWINKSRKQIRKSLSEEINKLIELVTEICSEIELDFKPDKRDSRYIQYGASNVFVTFKLWYTSSITNREEFVKIQINFLEKILYKLEERLTKNLIENIDINEVRFLFPEYEKIVSAKNEMISYNVQEILIEKVRAITTRKGIKERDFLDVYLILKFLKKDLENYEEKIIEKTLFALKYEKYAKNLFEKRYEPFKLEVQEKILIMPIDKGFDVFLDKFFPFLNQVLQKIKEKAK